MDPTYTHLPSEVDAAGRGLDIRLVPLDVPGGFEEAAASAGLTSEDGVKTLVVKISGGTSALVLVPGTRRLDWAKLRRYSR